MLKLNKKGFTLVELLAVIVVLAIIMVIAAPAVMKQMENARKGTFKTFAQTALQKAEVQYQSDLMLNALESNPKKYPNTFVGAERGIYCYVLDKLDINAAALKKYEGAVVVTIDSESRAEFYVTVKDLSSSATILKKTAAGLEEANAVRTDQTVADALLKCTGSSWTK